MGALDLPAADSARLARERLVASLGGRLGRRDTAGPGRRPAGLRRRRTARAAIGGLLRDIRATAGTLARQNALNRQLAEFCLDLAHEEAEIFKRCVLQDPAGCYRGDARQNDRGPGGVIVRQA